MNLLGCFVAVLLVASLDAGVPSPPASVGHPVVQGEGYRGVIFPSPPFQPTAVRGDAIWCPAHEDVQRFEAGLQAALKELLRDPRAIRRMCREGALTRWCCGSDLTRKAEVKAILKELPLYLRQYAGVVLAGKRTLIANFFLDPLDADWRSEWVDVLGGGTGYWSIAFNVEDQLFHRLRVNSPR